MKPIIGVTPLFDNDLKSFWILDNYMEAIRDTGGIPVVLGYTDTPEDFPRIAARFDGFVFTGGQDFDPALYGQEKKETCGVLAEKRDILETGLMPEVLKRDVPLLGICRGMQLLNAILGGDLYQDLSTDFSDKVNHDREKPNDAFHHRIVVDRETFPGRLLGEKYVKVNSLHHQGVDTLAPELVPFAVSEEDGLTEGFFHPDKTWVVGVQWHPELIYKKSPGNRRIWEDFIAKAKVVGEER